jgi:hypothetical protein
MNDYDVIVDLVPLIQREGTMEDNTLVQLSCSTTWGICTQVNKPHRLTSAAPRLHISDKHL